MTLATGSPTKPATPANPCLLALREVLRAGLAPGEVRRLHRSLRSIISPPPSLRLDPAWEGQLEGALREAEGEPEQALTAYQAALAVSGYHRSPAETADVHQGMARCLLALGRYEPALRHAEEAVRLLQRWPGWRRAEAEALLRRLGGGQTTSGPEALTSREREVAALLAEGLSNSQLARRLYISPKTASVHVSNILTKLGMSSRTEIAAWAVRERLGVPSARDQHER